MDLEDHTQCLSSSRHPPQGHSALPRWSHGWRPLQQKKHLPIGHSLAWLNLAVDDNGVLTVGTRVRDPSHAFLSKALIPLSLSSGVTTLFIRSSHISLRHRFSLNLCRLISYPRPTKLPQESVSRVYFLPKSVRSTPLSTDGSAASTRQHLLSRSLVWTLLDHSPFAPVIPGNPDFTKHTSAFLCVLPPKQSTLSSPQTSSWRHSTGSSPGEVPRPTSTATMAPTL